MRCRRARLLIVLGCLTTVLAGCSSVVDGTGTAAPRPSDSSSSRSSSTTPTSRSTSGPTSGPSSTAAPVPAAYPRVPRPTSLGDPVTADICTAVGLPAMTLPGYQPTFADIVFPPGCTVRESKGGVRQFSVTVFADYPNTVSVGAGRRETSSAGLRVYAFPYAKPLGNCERDLVVTGATLKIDVVSMYGTVQANPTDVCHGADAMTNRLARLAVVGPTAFPRLSLASPSVFDHDLCAATRAVTLTDIPAYAGATVDDEGFATSCGLSKGGSYLDYEVGTPGPPVGTRLQRVGGHSLFVSLYSTSCNFYSLQGRTPTGRNERITLTAEDAKSCDQAGTVLARVLDRIGLP